ncbi:MAG TPA: Lrp/AsnC ligand binding domain-containing protein [Candidatus Thermoplasmatota archaeon]|nr:Lrp/AsnC ligand binding domain-containing protein [Candidatus Thermoplasmatota archaeon]
MADGFLLITVKPEYEHNVYRHLTGITGVANITPLYGEYDLLVYLTAESFDHMGDLLMSIRSIEAIDDTKFLPKLEQ